MQVAPPNDFFWVRGMARPSECDGIPYLAGSRANAALLGLAAAGAAGSGQPLAQHPGSPHQRGAAAAAGLAQQGDVHARIAQQLKMGSPGKGVGRPSLLGKRPAGQAAADAAAAAGGAAAPGAKRQRMEQALLKARNHKLGQSPLHGAGKITSPVAGVTGAMRGAKGGAVTAAGATDDVSPDASPGGAGGRRKQRVPVRAFCVAPKPKRGLGVQFDRAQIFVHSRTKVPLIDVSPPYGTVVSTLLL